MNVKDIMTIMQDLAPTYLAEKWDNVGLLVGSTTAEVKRILITLDITPAVVNEAIEQQVDLIIAHHPLIFKSIKSITNQTTQGQMLLDLIKSNINVYASHTNLDSVTGGMNDWLANQLQLNNTQILIPELNVSLYCLVTYIPTEAVDAVKQALFYAGAGQIDNYQECAFSSTGIGQFKGNDFIQPVMGKQHQVEYISEVKVEVQVDKDKLPTVIQTLKQVHPYETPVYHLFNLANEQPAKHGLGKIGYLSQNITLLELAKQCKQVFNTPMIKMIGPANKIVSKVAIVGGSGSDFISQAQQQGADVYITGDISYHTALDALDSNMAILDAGHYIEHIVKEQLSQILSMKLENQNIDVIQSTINTNPYKYIMS